MGVHHQGTMIEIVDMIEEVTEGAEIEMAVEDLTDMNPQEKEEVMIEMTEETTEEMAIEAMASVETIEIEDMEAIEIEDMVVIEIEDMEETDITETTGEIEEVTIDMIDVMTE